jgi:PAS domain S-box-containing protein
VFERIRRFFYPPTFSDLEKTRRAQLLNYILWSIIAVLVLVLVIGFLNIPNPFQGKSLQTWLLLTGLIGIMLGLRILVQMGRVQEASLALVLVSWCSMTFQAWNADGIRDTTVVVQLVILVMGSILLGWRATAVLAVLDLINIWIMAWMETIHGFGPALDQPLGVARDLTGIFILASILIFLVQSNLQSSLKALRQSEGALRASEERFRKVFEASPVAICITTLEEGVLVEANAAYWILSGYDPEKAVGHSVLELEPWFTPDERRAFVDELRQKRSIYNLEYQFQTVRGELKSTTAFYELIQLGELTCILSMFYDVTAQRHAQEALQASEERFRTVFHSGRMAIYIASLEQGRFIDANQAFWELSGLQPGQALGHTTLELGLWGNAGERDEFVRALREKRSLQNLEHEFLRDGQDRRSARAFYEMVYLEDELCVLAMFFDITEQKKAQEALRHSEARTRALLEAIPDMIFEISRDGTFLNFVPSMDAKPWVAPEEFLGKNIKDIMPPPVAAQTRFALERALESGQLHAFEFGLPGGEEPQFFEARIAALSTDSALVMVRDISRRRWVETENEKLIRELEDKNAELERFTYTVSHDLKSPLITIKGFLGFLEKDASGGDSRRLRSDIQRISDATDKMQLLLNELLELSRIGRLMNQPQALPFEELAQDAVQLVQGRLQERGIKVQVQRGMSSAYGDRQRLTEVVQNLVDNAAKFMGDQRRPCIEIGQQGEENGKPIFFVRDNGIGIAPEHQDRIFGLFNKLDVNTEGTGIGLALVKRIVEVHGGRIWVESKPGEGSSFCFTLQPGPAA